MSGIITQPSVDINTEQTERRRETRNQHPFVRNVDRTTVQSQEVNNRTRTGVRTSLVPNIKKYKYW